MKDKAERRKRRQEKKDRLARQAATKAADATNDNPIDTPVEPTTVMTQATSVEEKQAQPKETVKNKPDPKASGNIATAEEVLACIFPSDYYEGDIEPKGRTFLSNGTISMDILQAEQTGTAKNLKKIPEIKQALTDLGLSDSSVDAIVGVTSDIVVRMISERSNVQSMLENKVVYTNFKYSDEYPFGVHVEGTPISADQIQFVADLKANLKNLIVRELEKNAEFFAIPSNRSNANTAGPRPGNNL